MQKVSDVFLNANGCLFVSGVYSAHEGTEGLGTGSSKLLLVLSRGDLGARFECRVHSEALAQPISSWITADVNGEYIPIPPIKILIILTRNYVKRYTNNDFLM